MKIAFNPSNSSKNILDLIKTNKDIIFDLKGHSIYARGVEFKGTDTNTWRDIKINNVSIGSHTLDLRNGNNTTLTNTNGVVTINSTWRPVVDNLTSNSTTSSLSANQGRVLAGLINTLDTNISNQYALRNGSNATGRWRGGLSCFDVRDTNYTPHDLNMGLELLFLKNDTNNLKDGGMYNGVFSFRQWSSGSDWSGGKAHQLSFTDNENIWHRTSSGDDSWGAWKKLAYSTDIPSSLKNPYALTISLNGTSQGPYDGSVAKNINITPGSIGAATSGHNHDDRYLKLTGGVLKGQIILPDIDVNTSYTGSIIIGASNTENLGIDGNEIMARNNGKASTLYLNNEGGAVQLGAILRTNSNIAYIGSQSTQNMIKFINNTSDSYGNGIAIGGGGLTIIGSGESSDVVMDQHSSGGDENMIIAGDGTIDFYSNLQDGWKYGKHMYLDTNGFLFTPSYINIGGNENNNSSPDRVWGSNSSDSYLRSYRTSALRVAYASNADKLDGYHESSFLRYRGFTKTNQEATLWNQIGIKEYQGALPDGLTNVYDWGSVISLPSSSSRFEIYASDWSSSGNGLYYRSGWNDTKRPWLKFIDSSNIGSQSVNYANSAGDADTVDGYHATSGRTFNGNINWSLNWNDAWSDGTNKHPWYGFDHRYPNTGPYSTTISDYFGMTIKTANTLRLDCKNLLINGTNISNLNVASASKLQTARKIWGQSFDGTADVDNTLRIRKTTGSYCEGIRIQTGDGNWATIILGATADSGTNTNAWSIHRKADNNFAISRNSSDGLNGLVMTSTGMGLGTTAPTQRLDVAGNIRATGQLYLPTNGNYNAILMGDDCWLGDCNIGNVIGLSGCGNSNAGGIKFGKGGMHIGYNGSNHYSSGTSLWSNFNADLLDSYHYNSFAPFNGVKFAHIPGDTIWHRILQFTTDWVGSITFMYSPEEYQRTYWGIFNINIRSKGIWFRGFSFADVPQIKCIGDDNNNWSVWVKGTTNSYDPYGVIQVLNYSNASIINVGLDKSQTTEPSGTYYKYPSLFYAGSVDWNSITNKPDTFTPSAHTHTWTSITDKIVRGNEFNIVNAGFKEGMWFNYLPINDRSKTATISGYHFGNGAKGYTAVKASGFIKNGSNDSYVLLGGGGHKTESSLRVAYASSAGSATSATKVIVNQHTTNDINYPLVWSNQANTSNVTENQLYKSWADLYYNPKNKRLTVGGSVVTSSFIKSGGTSQQLLRADGGIASFNWTGQSGQPAWLWGGNSEHSYYVYNPSNFRVAYASSAGNADTLDGEHASSFVRAGAIEVGSPDLNALDTYSFIKSVNSQVAGHSPKGNIGWYNVIQLVHRNGADDGPSYIGQIALGMTTNVNDIFFRTRRTDPWKTIIHSNNYTEFIDNYYWANVKISTSANTQTTPSVNTIFANNWFRSQGDTGWYNESYGGGIRMTDTKWIRTFGGKSFYCDSQISSQGFHHLNHDNNDAVLLAGGSYMIHKTGSTSYSTAIQFGNYVWLTLSTDKATSNCQVVPYNISNPTKNVYVTSIQIGNYNNSRNGVYRVAPNGKLYYVQGTEEGAIHATICYIAS